MVEILTEIFPEVKKIRLDAFADERGFFTEFYRKSLYADKGIDCEFFQANHSYSVKGTIRGMHFQSSPGQAKLITVIVGKIYDVFVDIRIDSPSFGKWGRCILDANEHEQLFIPEGFAHGFATLSDEAHLIYKVSSEFDPATERAFRFNDPEVGIDWPIERPILSSRDKKAPSLREALL